MPGRKQPPEYFPARRALSQHLYHHHAGTTGEGMLKNRLDQHEEIHIVARRVGLDLGHVHEPCEEGETDIEIAWRMLREGQEQDKKEIGTRRSIAMDLESRKRRDLGKGNNGQADAADNS